MTPQHISQYIRRNEQAKLRLAMLQNSLERTVDVISDTHVPDRARKIPERVFEAFQNVDFIVHAGDLTQLSVIDDLQKLAPVLCVCGNTDKLEIREKLPRLDSLRIFDWNIGVMHNPASHLGLGRMQEIASSNRFDALVYGHTHRPSIKWDRKLLLMNPGSPTNPSPAFLTKPSVGLLRITEKRITPHIVQI